MSTMSVVTAVFRKRSGVGGSEKESANLVGVTVSEEVCMRPAEDAVADAGTVALTDAVKTH